MSDTPRYADEVMIGDRIIYEGEVARVTAVTPIPLTEEDYYGPAGPSGYTFEVEYGDGTVDEFTRYEGDILVVTD